MVDQLREISSPTGLKLSRIFTPTYLIACLMFLLFAPGITSRAQTVDKSRIPDVTVYKAMLDANRQTGWVQFRNFGGRQYIYFTPLQTLHCRLGEIRYSIDDVSLDQRFELVECNPQLPFSLPDDAGLDEISISLQPDTAKTVAVQVIWEDGTMSDISVYEPCGDAGEQSCAWLVE